MVKSPIIWVNFYWDRKIHDLKDKGKKVMKQNPFVWLFGYMTKHFQEADWDNQRNQFKTCEKNTLPHFHTLYKQHIVVTFTGFTIVSSTSLCLYL